MRAESISKTAGSTSYSTSIRSRASSAISSVVAATRATASPTYLHFLVEDAHVAGCAAPAIRDIFPGEDRLHARERLGLALVDLLDQRMGMGASEHLSVEKILKFQIVQVYCTAPVTMSAASLRGIGLPIYL